MGRWEAKVFWVVFFRNEQESSFSEESAGRWLVLCILAAGGGERTGSETTDRAIFAVVRRSGPPG
jgi:hypothetical protein